MNNRINNIFSNNKKKLITFVTGGDPNFSISNKIIKSLAKSGADIIEIGMPFSDPMADGPTIQLSSNRAIKEGIDLNKIFNLCENIRNVNSDIPLILMGYYNVVYHYGIDNFVNACEKFGIDGLIIVDLQPEEDSSLLSKIKSKNIDLIRLITPTTNEDRLKTILKNASGFLYYVTITGITGQQSADIEKLRQSIIKVKKSTKLPVVAGFGIKNANQAKEICTFADGVVVGSSIINIIEKNYKSKKNEIISKISEFVINLKKGILS
jgi:tryptophan synthase alpha chain